MGQDQSFQEGKDNLFSGTSLEITPGSTTGKEKLLDRGVQVADQNKKLAEAKKHAYESEDVAINIQRELNRHTEVIRRAISNSQQADQEIGKSNNLLNSISRRMMMNKITLYAVLAFIVLTIIIIIWAKFS
eukprot:TRINITY_DN7425_c0_g3_i2.p1 TRINITY_DN7425_c0_g3~~TRINITY_DN7425_c0_g3_i2.p1  ORF type:complete len:144 (+),score=25.58 TRINITY_DN7425_c0_g3_i2:42-434(+)